MRKKVSCSFFILVTIFFGQLTLASQETTGPNGIDSSGLGLTGNGVGIGQVEIGRPGDPKDNSQPGPPYPDFDTITARLNDAIDPERVFFTTVDPNTGTPSFTATPNAVGETGSGHATRVAGVIISTDTAIVNGDTAIGVSPQADLFSTGLAVSSGQDPLDILSVAAQYIATSNGGNIRAINMSIGVDAAGEVPDGTSLFSSFVDWSARVHDVLYVTSGPEVLPNNPSLETPFDNFNGITVAMSDRDANGKYRIVHANNVLVTHPNSAFTQRTYIDLLAPGRDVFVANQGNTTATVGGTSFAAPHVTGTVALLQEYANTQIGNSVPGWTPLARRHQVMKAVLMNSADKIEDNGMFVPFGKTTPVPLGGLLGMTRTVLKTDGTNWDDADASFMTGIPLDEEMGAGQLNAARAVQQFAPGEFDPNGAPVPVIGWDYGDAGGLNSINKYVFDQELLADSYISVTLAWDREVTFLSDGGTPGAFDSGDTFKGYSQPDADDVINDLDLFLMPKGSTSTDPYNDAIWYSGQDFMPLEHMFIQIPVTDEYEIWVRQEDNDLGGGQEYGIAWWALGAEPLLLADFDNDNDVDGADFLAWQRNTSLGNLADWESEFGMTGGALAASSAVPEPSTGLLLLTGLGFAMLFRPRRGSPKTIN